MCLKWMLLPYAGVYDDGFSAEYPFDGEITVSLWLLIPLSIRLESVSLSLGCGHGYDVSVVV